MFKLRFPISSSEKARLLSCSPLGWSDSFCLDFHMALDSDPKLWMKVYDGVYKVVSFSRSSEFPWYAFRIPGDGP